MSLYRLHVLHYSVLGPDTEKWKRMSSWKGFLSYVFFCFGWRQGLGMVVICNLIAPVLRYQAAIFPELSHQFAIIWLKSAHPLIWHFAIFLTKSIWAQFSMFPPSQCTHTHAGTHSWLLCGRPVTDGSFHLCPNLTSLKTRTDLFSPDGLVAWLDGLDVWWAVFML